MAIPPKNPPISAPTLAQLQATLSSLQTATYILDGITHRNKNQHRGIKWWASFDSLRRSLHKITPHLEGAVQRAELVLPLSTGGKSSKRRKMAQAPMKAAKQPELERAVERAVWIKNVLGPRAYEAFTQLIADRQFAQLGLVLIGVLAQVHAAIAPLIPPAEPENLTEKDSVPAQLGGGDEAHDDKATVSGATDFDLGVAVSRDELLDSDDDDDDEDVHPAIEGMTSSATRPPPLEAEERRELHRVPEKKRKTTRRQREDESEIRISTKKRNIPRQVNDVSPAMSRTADAVTKEMKKQREKLKLRTDGARTTEADLMSRFASEPRGVKKPKTKKKKTKGGDEFDSLFSSLL